METWLVQHFPLECKELGNEHQRSKDVLNTYSYIWFFFVRDFHWVAWRRKKFNRKLFPWWHQSTPTVATCITCVVTLLVLLQLGLTKVVTCKLLSKSFPVFQSEMSLNWSKYSLQKLGIWKVDTILDCHLGVEFPVYNVHFEMHDVASLVLPFVIIQLIHSGHLS